MHLYVCMCSELSTLSSFLVDIVELQLNSNTSGEYDISTQLY